MAPAIRRASPLGHTLALEQISYALAGTTGHVICTANQYLGGQATGVVVARHHETVGPGAQDRQHLARFRNAHRTAPGQEVTALAHGTDDVTLVQGVAGLNGGWKRRLARDLDANVACCRVRTVGDVRTKAEVGPTR